MSKKIIGKAYAFFFALALVVFAGFFMQANAQVTAKMTYPTSGTSLLGGQQINITWNVSVVNNSKFLEQEIYVSYNGGKSYELITAELPSSQRSFAWTVPNRTSRGVIVDIRCGNGIRGPEYLNPQRTTTFDIIATKGVVPTVTMGKVAKKKVSPGEKVEIHWDANFEDIENYEVRVSFDEGLHFQTLDKTTEQSYVWTAPEVGTARVTFQIVANTKDGKKFASRIPVKPMIVLE
jgi:hypothetical protein